MANELLDPRVARPFPAQHPLAGAISALSATCVAGDSSRAIDILTNALRKLIERGENGAIVSARDAIAPGRMAKDFNTALDDAISAGVESDEFLLVARLFLLPVLFVTAGKSPAVVQGVLPDAAELQRTLKSSGALGAIENFGIGNALATQAMASAIDPVRLWRASRALSEGGGALDLLLPEDIVIDSANEQVHLRYLAGAAVSASHAPTFLETAGTVGRWGIGVSQALSRQLAEPGLQLLTLPRAPMRWYSALAEGSYALEELRFNLFLSNALRELRASTGEPDVTITAPLGDQVRIELASQFDDMQRYSHAWRLHATDTIERVEDSILGLLRDCRVDRIAFSVRTDLS